MSIKRLGTDNYLVGMFEIDVILDEYQTPNASVFIFWQFEIDVILDEYQTLRLM